MNPKNDNVYCMAIMTRSRKAVGSDAIKHDFVIESKGKTKLIDEEEIPEEVKLMILKYLSPNSKCESRE